MTEQEWLSSTFALLLMQQADTYRRDDDDAPTGGDWRSVAARVACLEQLGPEMPDRVRAWVRQAVAYLDKENRLAPAGPTLFDSQSPVYAAFREAYALADPDLRQRLAAAQDVFHGADYYACEEYMLDADESSLTYTGPAYAAEAAAHCGIIRDIFGNPFRPVAVQPSWLTSTAVAVAVAEGIYRDRAFDRLPILADALQDVGCEHPDILAHCREPVGHVRGCWVVDMVRGRT